MAQTIAFFLPSAETDGVAPGFANLVAGGRVHPELSILNGVVAQVVVAGSEEGVAIPVCHCPVTAACHVYSSDSCVAIGMELSHLVAVNHIDHGILGGLQKQVTMGTGLIGQEQWSAGTNVGVSVAECDPDREA